MVAYTLSRSRKVDYLADPPQRTGNTFSLQAKCHLITTGLTLIVGTTTFIHISIDVLILLGHINVCKKKVLEPADVVVYYWSKPTLGRT